MSLRLLRFLNCSDWAGTFLKEGCGLFVFCQLTQFRVTEEVTAKLIKSTYHQIERDGILATRLCTHKDDVDLTNENKLQQLPGLNSSDRPPPTKKKNNNTCVSLFGLDPSENGQHIWQPCYNPFPLKSVVYPAWQFEKFFIYFFLSCFINWHRHF